MTYRTLVHYGLVAGLTYTELGMLSPGMVCDLYIMRLRYDDMEHGIKRKKEVIYD